MAVCDPIPTSTLFSTSTSYVITTITTSTPVVVTPTAGVRTTTISSCLSSASNAALLSANQPTSLTSTAASSSIPSRDLLADDGTSDLISSHLTPSEQEVPTITTNHDVETNPVVTTSSSEIKSSGSPRNDSYTIRSIKPSIRPITDSLSSTGTITLRLSFSPVQSSSLTKRRSTEWQGTVSGTIASTTTAILEDTTTSMIMTTSSLSVTSVVTTGSIQSTASAGKTESGTTSTKTAPTPSTRTISRSAASVAWTSTTSSIGSHKDGHLTFSEVIGTSTFRSSTANTATFWKTLKPSSSSRRSSTATASATDKSARHITSTLSNTRGKQLETSSTHSRAAGSGPESSRTASPTRRIQARKRHDGNHTSCESWTAIESYITTHPTASTSWKETIITTASASLVIVPTETLYRSCATQVAPSLSSDGTLSASPKILSAEQAGSTVLTSETTDSIGTFVGVVPITTTRSIRSTLAADLITSHDVPSSTLVNPIILSKVEDSTAARGVMSSATMTPTRAIRLSASTSISQSVITPGHSPSSHPASVPANIPSTTDFPATTPPDVLTTQISITTDTATALPIPQSASAQSSKAVVVTTSVNSSAEAQQASSSNKGVSAGAAVGGVIGIFAVIASLLFCVRWVTKRKRTQRTRELRSSWFYGGDLGEPEDDTRRDTGSVSQRSIQQPISRFSAPSIASETSGRIHRAVPAFLALPISHIRNGSGRFPHLMSNIRNSIAPPKPTPTVEVPQTPPWSSPNTIVPSWSASTQGRPRVPPPEMGSSDSHAKLVITTPPMSELPNQTSMHQTHAAPPRLELAHHEPTLDWGDSAPALRVTQATDSFYSQLETVPSMYSQYQSRTNDTGRALTASERVSPVGVNRSPFPPITMPPKPPRLQLLLTSRDLLAPGMTQPHTSSLFEYTDFAGSRHASAATSKSREGDQARQTRNWYDKPLWDRQNSTGDESIYGGMMRDGSIGRTRRERARSTKSVRWDDEAEPKLF